MQITLSGSVYYANGNPMSGVTVRIFDRDAAGKEDDDLTVNQGISDHQGGFTITYEPQRYLDYYTYHLAGSSSETDASDGTQHDVVLPDLGDIYLPYLRFNYTYNQVEREYSASLGLFQTRFYLPVNPPVTFLPSLNGFKFPNSFSGYFLPYSTPAFLNRKVLSTYGLCGGMCAAAYDFLLADRPIPPTTNVPSQGSRLQRYLFQRQMDSLGGLGQAAVKVAQWTSLPDDTLVGTFRRTADEFAELRQKLDEGNLVVLALIYEHATSLKELRKVIFNNHQVLAYGCQVSDDGKVTINVYDPNLPGWDDVDISAEPVELGQDNSPGRPVPIMGLDSTQRVGGTQYRRVRGFFAMPYSPVTPPENL
jgi:hypothetical protein